MDENENKKVSERYQNETVIYKYSYLLVEFKGVENIHMYSLIHMYETYRSITVDIKTHKTIVWSLFGIIHKNKLAEHGIHYLRYNLIGFKNSVLL